MIYGYVPVIHQVGTRYTHEPNIHDWQIELLPLRQVILALQDGQVETYQNIHTQRKKNSLLFQKQKTFIFPVKTKVQS